MLHNEIEQSVLTAQKLALESLRKDGLVVESTPLKYKVLLDNDKDKLEEQLNSLLRYETTKPIPETYYVKETVEQVYELCQPNVICEDPNFIKK